MVIVCWQLPGEDMLLQFPTLFLSLRFEILFLRLDVDV